MLRAKEGMRDAFIMHLFTEKLTLAFGGGDA